MTRRDNKKRVKEMSNLYIKHVHTKPSINNPCHSIDDDIVFISYFSWVNIVSSTLASHERKQRRGLVNILGMCIDIYSLFFICTYCKHAAL